MKGNNYDSPGLFLDEHHVTATLPVKNKPGTTKGPGHVLPGES